MKILQNLRDLFIIHLIIKAFRRLTGHNGETYDDKTETPSTTPEPIVDDSTEPNLLNWNTRPTPPATDHPRYTLPTTYLNDDVDDDEEADTYDELDYHFGQSIGFGHSKGLGGFDPFDPFDDI